MRTVDNTTVSSTTQQIISTTTAAAGRGTGQHHVDQQMGPPLVDTIAAVTIAVLACILVITVALIVRAVRRRQRQDRGRELNIIPTISAGIVSANVGAYGGPVRSSSQPTRDAAQSQSASSSGRSPRPTRGVITWEPVVPSTSSADIMPSSALSGAPSSC